MTFYLYADAKPSETIKKQENDPAGLAVACILPHKNDEQILDVPIKQYKEYNTKQKEARARTLTAWLKKKRGEGLQISGFLVARSLTAAARYGIDLIEELPDTRVEPHYNSYRLYFGDQPIDFTQAVALMYYYFPVAFGCLRSWKNIKEGERDLVVFLDRFPAVSGGNRRPGESAPKTQGMKFFEFIRKNSETAKGIDKDDESAGAYCKHTNLEWWRKTSREALKEGKEHPHFVLTDWLVASALAHSFREEFIEEYTNKKTAERTTDALIDLYQEFKKFDIWEIADDNTLDHITSNEKQWTVPEDARAFILSNIENKC